ncbi:MAG TPA: LLM class flavin-dependent oxidoreductase [Euzebyales bacterium]|nr:LLM class flavin-dependent oxidoreductase [Euzebyales bacterium]
MRLSVMIEPQEGMTYDEILAVAQRAEAVGLAGFYRSDHYSPIGAPAGAPTTDAWATLAGLARETSDITLGTMVTPATFRPIGNLAKVVATVAEMAGALDGEPRIHLGMGTGWHETEHRQHGFPFEDIATRFRRLDEHLQVLHGLWDPERDPFSFDGEFVTIDEARYAPVPTPRPRIVVGGSGRRKTPTLAARYADELNTIYRSPEDCRGMRQAMDEACGREDRDPATLPLTLMTGCVIGADETAFRARARRVHAAVGSGDVDTWLDELRGTWVLGGPEEAADHIGRLADAGVTGVLLQHQAPGDLDMLDEVMAEIAPRL